MSHQLSVILSPYMFHGALEFFKIFPEHKNGNIINFVLAMLFKIKKTNEVSNCES